MSAICGVWRFDGKPDIAVDCARMLAAQEIYGPHDGRAWSEGPIAFGRRLFRTLPEDVHDRQPLTAADGRLVLVADVRLDNRDDLASSLGWSASRVAQSSDAAMLLASLERWNEHAVNRLVGDFAFALWNVRTETLLLARDILGQRPLYYYRGKEFFAFASMAKGLHALDEVPYAPHEQTVAELITLMPQHRGRSYFRDIDSVQTGHFAVISRGSISERCYWNPSRPAGATAGAKDYREGLRHHLDLATRSRLRGANSAVATHLSGGLDSSSVTATTARLLAPESGRVVAFTAVPREGYANPSHKGRFDDEGPLAAATAALYPNIEHVFIRTGHRSPLHDLDRHFFLFERPAFNPCNEVWLGAINDAARERHLGILLTGEKGNFSLSYHGLEFLPELLRAGRFVRFAREAAMLRFTGHQRLAGTLWAMFGAFAPAWLWRLSNRAIGRQNRDVACYSAIRSDRLADLALRSLARQRGHDFSPRPGNDGFAVRLGALRRFNQGNINKGTLAGWGIDRRDPTSDKRLLEFCLSVPMEEYLSKGIPRALIRRAMVDRLPQAVLKEPRKGLQAVDWHEGLTAARFEVTAELERLAQCPAAAGLLDVERLKRLAAHWPASGWERGEIMEAYRLALLRGIAAGHFLRKASQLN